VKMQNYEDYLKCFIYIRQAAPAIHCMCFTTTLQHCIKLRQIISNHPNDRFFRLQRSELSSTQETNHDSIVNCYFNRCRRCLRLRVVSALNSVEIATAKKAIGLRIT